MSATGRQPTATKSLNEVFIPSAAMAMTRQSLETVLAASVTGLENRPRLFAATKAAKPNRNQGTGALALPDDPPADPATRNAIVKTTGNSNVTRSSLT